MVNSGFGQRETTRRLARLERTPENLTGILVTHEHGDHAGGVFAFARQHGLPVWLTHGTWSACAAAATGVDIRIIDSHGSFAIDSLEVCPYPVPHDAREPVQYVFSDGARRLGLLTDVGEITPHVRQVLSGVDGLILECNHDADLLAASDYPPSLQRRISGRLGHLENTVAADLLRGDRLHAVATLSWQRISASATTVRNWLSGLWPAQWVARRDGLPSHVRQKGSPGGNWRER